MISTSSAKIHGSPAIFGKWQRQGIGEILMVEAMQRALLVADTAGGIGLFVDRRMKLPKVIMLVMVWSL